MLVISAITFHIIIETLNMSFVQRLFKKPSKEKAHNSLTNIQNDANSCEEKLSSPDVKVQTPTGSDRTKSNSRKSRRKRNELSEKIYQESMGTSSESEKDTEVFEARYIEDKKKKLHHQINKYARQQEHLRRSQNDVITLENEIQQVIKLINIAKQQTAALNEDVINKKCELNFLTSEVPDDFEEEAKRRDPLYYKKYNNINALTDASNLLVNIRHRIKGLHYLELLTYEKYLDYQYNLKSPPVKTKSVLLGKNKKRNFGHLSTAINCHNLGFHEFQSHSEQQTQKPEITTQSPTMATITIESRPTLDSSPEVSSPTATSSTLPAPLVPVSVFRNPLSLISASSINQETLI